jgi:hypothetical protein
VGTKKKKRIPPSREIRKREYRKITGELRGSNLTLENNEEDVKEEGVSSPAEMGSPSYRVASLFSFFLL